jgi:Dolichyl-phosphate-mannose-protein mannosyltransferase
VPTGTAWARFKQDMRDVRERYGKRTSGPHKRFVWALILAGAGLRVWLAWQPITAGESTIYMAFASRHAWDVISDYSMPGNHVLHTLLAKCSTGLFGTNEAVLRLPALLASILTLPLFYLFVRSVFNRYIALMALAMAASMPALAEVGALAYGYSLSGLFIMFALVLGRHFAREDNGLSAILMGVSCALAMWSVPTAVFGVIMVYLWVLFTLLSKYERSLGARMGALGGSLVVFIVATVLLYLPVVVTHGADQLFRHATEGERNWRAFSAAYPDKVLEFWVWITDPGFWWVSVIGMLAMVQAAYVSGKYRVLLLTTALGAIPLSVALADAGDAWQWAYTVYTFIIGGAIGLFYLLKLVQDKLLPKLGKRTRTGWAGLILFLGFAIPGTTVVRSRVNHLPEAEACAEALEQGMRPADRLCMDAIWDAPVGFELRQRGIDARALHGTPDPGGFLFVVALEPHGPGPEVVAMRCDERLANYGELSVVRDWPRMGIFAARLR